MQMTIKISRESLISKNYKDRKTEKIGSAPTNRNTEALTELLKALKKS